MGSRRTRVHLRGLALFLLLAPVLSVPSIASAASTCGTSDGHTLCVTVPAGSLSGPIPVRVTNAANTGKVIASWVPSGKSAIPLILKAKPSPETGDYSFVWPTQKYLDGSGVLRVQHGSASSTAVTVSVTLSNGNTTDFQHTPSDWASYLPGTWSGSADPVLAAVGDGPSDEPVPNALAASIVAADPAQFLYLGDVYEKGTFTENLNHYGVSSLDGTAGTLWGVLADRTQPTLGNHEAPNLGAWRDYWHGRPAYTSFTFGGVLFLDLNSNTPMKAGSPQYAFVQAALSGAPPCVVAYWHSPVLANDSVSSARLPMWSLLANNGGDLVLNGHRHSMAEYEPLDANLQPGGHQVEIISGAGGHSIGKGGSDSSGRLKWTLGKTAGALYLTLEGAANGGVASSIAWSFQDTGHTVLETGSITC
jgi:hypothetical protein